MSILTTGACALVACGSDDDDNGSADATPDANGGSTPDSATTPPTADATVPADATLMGDDDTGDGSIVIVTMDAGQGADAGDATLANDGGGGDAGDAGDATTAPDADSGDASHDASDASDAGDASDGGDAYALYNQDQIPEFALSVDGGNYAILTDTDAASENTWAEGDITITSPLGTDTITNVGFRRKGASTFVAAPDKTSLKVEFNKFVKGQKFHGITDLTLNNMLSENTFLAERLAYYVYRAAGLPAELGNTGHVSITDPTNGKVDYGIYFNVETLDQDFLTRVYGKANAKTLYESNGGGDWKPGEETSFDIHVGADYSDLTKLFVTATNATSNPNFLTNLAPNLDTAELLKYCALEGLVGQIDGYAYGIYGSHNSDLAGDVNDLFTLVPWSLDLTFSDSTSIMNMAEPQLANPGDSSSLTVLGRCKADATCWASYKTTVSQMITMYNGLNLVALATSWHNQIDALASADPKKHISTSGYENETTKLYTWITNSPVRAKMNLGLP